MPSALESYIRVNGVRLLGFIRQSFPAALRQRFDPQDLYQTTVFEAFRRLDSFKHINDEATFAWLCTLARRQIGMALRSERREKRGGRINHVGLDDKAAVNLLEQYAALRKSPSQSAADHETFKLVDQALEQLPPHLREAVRLRYLEGLSPGELARAVGRTERAAAALCFRGIRLLRRKLAAASRGSAE